LEILYLTNDNIFGKKTRDREEGMNAFFSAVDTDSKGFITPADIVKLSKEVGKLLVSSDCWKGERLLITA
jgi:hypothetical protein